MLSTSADGRFQAIAQSCNTISLYWKSDDSTPVIYCNGLPVANLTHTVDPVSGFSTCILSDLTPNKKYTFSLGTNGPTISERTWAKLPDKAYYDLLIIGGSASGVSAAVTAARLGMKVALVEETNRVGGMASNGLGATDMRRMTRSNGFF